MLMCGKHHHNIVKKKKKKKIKEILLKLTRTMEHITYLYNVTLFSTDRLHKVALKSSAIFIFKVSNEEEM